MKNILLMNKIAACGTARFGEGYAVSDSVSSPDGIMVRSANLLDTTFDSSLQAIARAGAGVNNIPCDRLAEDGVVVFNTPGANANAVKELTVCALLLASRDIVEGSVWTGTLEGNELGVAKAVEKGKSSFAGCEILGKTLGVMGFGAIGRLVADAAKALGMKVVAYDAFPVKDSAVPMCETPDELLSAADYITLHIPSLPSTKGFLNAANIAKMKDGVKIINLARGDLAVNADLKAALASGKVKKYVTDFPSEELIGQKGIVCIPHLGASTEEAEDNCAVMAADELKDYLENGNIRNSVNYPALTVERKGAKRICLLCSAEMSAEAVAKAAGVCPCSLNTAVNEKKNSAYVIIDTEGEVQTEELSALPFVRRVLVK